VQAVHIYLANTLQAEPSELADAATAALPPHRRKNRYGDQGNGQIVRLPPWVRAPQAVLPNRGPSRRTTPNPTARVAAFPPLAPPYPLCAQAPPARLLSPLNCDRRDLASTTCKSRFHKLDCAHTIMVTERCVAPCQRGAGRYNKLSSA